METFSSMLQKEDADLYDHLVHVDALRSLPVRSWHHRCFAGTLHDKSLEKIWDKAIGGSTKILSYVAIAILVCCRRPLLGCRTSSEANQHVSWVGRPWPTFRILFVLPPSFQITPSLTRGAFLTLASSPLSVDRRGFGTHRQQGHRDVEKTRRRGPNAQLMTHHRTTLLYVRLSIKLDQLPFRVRLRPFRRRRPRDVCLVLRRDSVRGDRRSMASAARLRDWPTGAEFPFGSILAVARAVWRSDRRRSCSGCLSSPRSLLGSVLPGVRRLPCFARADSWIAGNTGSDEIRVESFSGSIIRIPGRGKLHPQRCFGASSIAP